MSTQRSKHGCKHVFCPCCVQVESETADAEFKLNNATQRLQRLERDVMLLRDKALNVTLSTKQTNQDAASIGKIMEEVKKVSSRARTVTLNAQVG